MHYKVRHVTRFVYDEPITESIMETRMQPRSELCQRCVRFQLTTSPATQVFAYPDSLGNMVHHFDIPGRHARLIVTAESIVEFVGCPEPPDALPQDAWAQVDAVAASGEHWDMLGPSTYVRDSPALRAFVESLHLDRSVDPLSLLRRISHCIYRGFAYTQDVTRVDSPIDLVLQTRQGVCQDFAHLMIAIVRPLGIPCRYVSGYQFHGAADRAVEGATHAWVEAFLPGPGWVGIDPTNNVMAQERHIRVAVGRDYADVPPTRGVYKGPAGSELAVSVQVSQTDLPPSPADLLPVTVRSVAREPLPPEPLPDQQQQQQQQ